jgi:hypothetical protein
VGGGSSPHTCAPFRTSPVITRLRRGRISGRARLGVGQEGQSRHQGQSAEPTGDRRACYRPDLVPVGAAGLRGVIARCALAQERALSPHGRFKPMCISRCGQAAPYLQGRPRRRPSPQPGAHAATGATPASWYPTSRLRTPRRSARGCSPRWLCYVLDASGRRGPNAAVASAPARARTRDMRRGARRALRASAHTADRRLLGGVLVT